MPEDPDKPRKIILLLDGTANALTKDTTNLPRLYHVLKKTDRQLVYYDPGVGTFESGNAVFRYMRRAKEVWGMATGWGLERNVKEAYRYLCQVTGEADVITDEIYLMGFSRGAHTARVLAGLIYHIGLLRPDQMNLVDYAFDAYRTISDKRSDDEPASAAFKAVDVFTSHIKPRRVPVRCLGLFDTVSSVISFDGLLPRMRPYASTNKNTGVQSVRHAVAIDERRIMFNRRLWGKGHRYTGRSKFAGKEAPPQDVNEVWFSGVHADVGGGYCEKKAELAKIPLKWMLDEMRPMGLDIDTRAFRRYVLGIYEDDPYVEPNALAKPQNSMVSLWHLVEFLPFHQGKFSDTPRLTVFGLYVPFYKRRHIPPGANIHGSVFERRGTEHDYPQSNIPDAYNVTPYIKEEIE